MTPQASFDKMDSDSDEDDERQKGQRRRVNLPPMRQKLTGHRNARTMIKVTISAKVPRFSYPKTRKQRGGGKTSSSLALTVVTSLPGIATLESASP